MSTLTTIKADIIAASAQVDSHSLSLAAALNSRDAAIEQLRQAAGSQPADDARRIAGTVEALLNPSPLHHALAASGLAAALGGPIAGVPESAYRALADADAHALTAIASLA